MNKVSIRFALEDGKEVGFVESFTLVPEPNDFVVLHGNVCYKVLYRIFSFDLMGVVVVVKEERL